MNISNKLLRVRHLTACVGVVGVLIVVQPQSLWAADGVSGGAPSVPAALASPAELPDPVTTPVMPATGAMAPTTPGAIGTTASALSGVSTPTAGGGSVAGAASAAASKPPVDISLPAPPPADALSVNASALDPKLAEEAATRQAELEAEAEKQRQKQQHIKESFERASGGLMPLTPSQIKDFMRRYEENEVASQLPSGGAPKAKVRIVSLSLDPGAEPPQIDLQNGYVTTVNMVDSTGEPWPILDIGIGGGFEASSTTAGTHIIRIMPTIAAGVGNLSVMLKDLPTPVIFRLSAGNGTVDMRYDARIPKFGPSAKVPLINRPNSLTAGDEKIMMILQNLPPEGAKRMKVVGLDARTKAWALGEKVYVRTPLKLLSPAWNASISSNDGTAVYEIGTAPVLLMSDGGAVVRAKLVQGDDDE